MTYKSTLVLLAIFVALCAGYWALGHFEGAQQTARVEAKKLFHFAPEAVAEIEIQQIDKPAAAAKRADDGSWAFVKPNANIEANQVLWNRVATALAGLVNNRVLETNPTVLAKFGLDPPALTFNAKIKDGDTIALTFGAVDPTQTCRYARHGDGPVFLVETKQYFELDRGLELLRNPYILNVSDKGITRLEFARFWKGRAESPAPEKAGKAGRPLGEESVVVAVQKDDNGRWRLVEPVQADARQEDVEALVKEIQFGVGRKYIDEPGNLKDYGLDPPTARITVFSGKGSPGQTLLLGTIETGDDKQAKGLYAKQAARPSVFVMDMQALALLPKTPETFRENRILTHPAKDIEQIHYVWGANDITFAADPEKGWIQVSPSDPDFDPMAINNFVVILKSLEGCGFPGDAQPHFGLDAPMISVTIKFKGVDQPCQVRIGAKVPDVEQYYATQDNGGVVLLRTLDIENLKKVPEDFHKLALMDFVPGEVTRVSIRIADTDIVFERPQGAWTLVQPPGKKLESPDDVEGLVEALGSGYVYGMVRPARPPDLAPYGLLKPTVTITITTATSDGTTVKETTHGPMSIGDAAENDSSKRYIMVEGRRGIFATSQALLDQIRATIKAIH